MTDQKHDNEVLLIDFLLGRCDEAQESKVRDRLSSEKAFRNLHDQISHTFSALSLAPQVAPPAELVEKTLRRIRQAQQTQALLSREQLSKRLLRPTFSLRELATVAAAVILMAFIFVPSVRQARRLAISGRCASQIGQIGSALLAYANANNDYLPGVGGQERRWLPAVDSPAVSNSAGLFKLVNYASPVVFQCPAVAGGSFVVRAGMMDFPAGRFISYSYQYTLGPDGLSRTDPVMTGVAESMAILADNTPVFRDGRFLRDRVRASASDNHGGTGQNVLYLDMHVEWAKKASVGVLGNNIYLAEGIYEYRGDEAPVGPTDTFLLPAYSR